MCLLSWRTRPVGPSCPWGHAHSQQQLKVYILGLQYQLVAKIRAMDEPTKLDIMKSDCLLQLVMAPAWVDCLVIDHSASKLSKHQCRLAVDGSMPKLAHFEDSRTLFQLLKDSSNYCLDVGRMLLTIKWSVVAAGFKKDYVFETTLQPTEMTEVDSLKLENVFLKRRLSNYEELRHKDVIFQCKSGKQTDLKAEEKSSKDVDEAYHQINDQQKKDILYAKVVQLEIKQNAPAKTKSIQKKKKSSKIDNKTAKQEQPEDGTTQRRRGRKKRNEFTVAQEQVERKQDTLSSKVKISFENGDYYFGEMKNNLYHGHGEYYSKTNGTFKGIWQNGKANGYGQSRDLQGNKHSGFYIDDKRNGQGVDQYKNGEKYEGNFAMDCKQGLGKYTYSNGDVYHGHWKSDLYHGKGKQYYHDGSLYEGSWVCDEKDGDGIYTDMNGTRFKQIWRAGVKVSQKQIK